MRRFFKIMAVLLAALVYPTAPALASSASSALNPEPPFVICQEQRYALCAAASCFVYDAVAYCKCDIEKGDSISLQLSYSSPQGEQNVCDVNQQGKNNGYMVSTFSLPEDVKKGGPAAIYTCPGPANAGSGVSAPVAYGQCDGGICFTSSRGKMFPGFPDQLQDDEIMCSCPISTDATPGSADQAGYQIFGPYNPNAPAGSRCDARACAACSVPNPTANGTSLPVGAPTGTGAFLTLRLNGPPLPEFNQCLCTCSQNPDGGVSCTVGADTTP